MSTSEIQPPTHDIVVVSDLHVGRGRNPDTGRFHNLETFFYDDDFRLFVTEMLQAARERNRKLRVVFNGDTFDLIRQEGTHDPDATWREQRFGLDLTPSVSAELVANLLRGHPVFVATLTDVLEQGGDVVMLPGNHDIEVQWPQVIDVIRKSVHAELSSRLSEETADEFMARFSVKPWFHYEPGRVWIEHGCQYDPECAFRYPLRASLPPEETSPTLLDLDMPLGNFFQRYLFNGFGPITFIVPSTRANGRYTRWLAVNQPRLLANVIFSHVPFIFQVLRRLAQKGVNDREPLERAHTALLSDLTTEEPGEALRSIDQLKQVEGDLTQTAREYSLQAIKLASLVLVGGLGAGVLWTSGFNAIQEIEGFGLKTVMFLGLNLVVLAAGLGAVVHALLRNPSEVTPKPLRRNAQEIARLLDVPIVTFGHTHDEAIWRMDRPSGRAWYYNTGTWIAVFTHDVLVPRERVQYTFLLVKDYDASLMYWSPGRGGPCPVVLLDDGHTELAPMAS